MYVTPIRLDLPLETNQISCCKGKWNVRRFDPETVETGHIYSSIKEGLTSTFSMGQAEDFVGGFDNHQQLDNQSEMQCSGYSYEHAMKGELFPLYEVLNQMSLSRSTSWVKM